MYEALTAILRILNELGIRYFGAGSVASSVHGVARFTQDVDLVVEIVDEQVDALVQRAGGEFYVDAEEARGSVSRGRAFNLIHLPSAYKIDIFPVGQSLFNASELSRAQPEAWIVPGSGTIRLPVASPEDTVLSKLVWYRDGRSFGSAVDRHTRRGCAFPARLELYAGMGRKAGCHRPAGKAAC